MENRQNLSFGKMFGYSLGTNIRVIENIFAFYFVFYLTTVAGVQPAAAGTISSMVVLWAAVISPIIGHFADRPGRKRKFVLVTTIPIAIFLYLLFSSFDLGPTGNIVYYVIVGMICYTLYYMFLVPYDSLGAELAEGYNTRTTMRGLCTAFVYITGIVGGTLTLFLQGQFAAQGMSPIKSWHMAVLLSCALVIIAGIAAYVSTKNIDKGPNPEEKMAMAEAKPENFFKSYAAMVKIKPVVSLVVFCLIYFTGTTFLATDIVYYGIYSVGLSEAAASVFFTVSTVATLITIPIVTPLLNKFGKKKILLAALWVIIIFCCVIFIVGPKSFLCGWIIMIGYSITNATVMIAAFSMLYDAADLAEFKTGTSKIGAAVGAFTFAMGVAQAIAYAIFGVVLQMGGFDAMAMAQSSKAIMTINLSATIIPSAFIVISILALLFYNIDKKGYEALSKALAAKREGKEYSTEGFEHLL